MNSGSGIKHAYRSLLPHMLPYGRLLGMGVLTLIVTDLMGMAIPWLIKEGIDAIPSLPAGGGAALALFPALILLAATLQGIFRYLWRVNIYGFSRHVEWELRHTLFAHLQRLPLAYFHRLKTGDLMSRLTNDIASLRELLGFGSLALIDGCLVVTLSVILMLTIDPWLTLWALLCLPGISLTVRSLGRGIFWRSGEVQRHLSTLSTFVQENLTGIQVVQAYAQEENQDRRFERLSRQYLAENVKLATLWGVLWPALRVFAGLATALVLWIGGRRVLNGEMTLGAFVAFNSYLTYLTWPLMAVGHLVNLYQRGVAALGRLVEVLQTPVAPGYLLEGPRQEKGDDAEGAALAGSISVKGLWFRYSEHGPWVLKGINLDLPAGARLGIVGEVGAGKSTLVNLLLRLYEPPVDTVWIGGRDLTTIPLRVLRRAIGYVPQEAFLFAGTIRENLLFGCLDGSALSSPQGGPQGELEEAARLAQLLPVAEELRERFNTLLGERGVRLSGGQRQRTALARALIRDPAILILDDPFSSIDAETEEAILANLQGYLQGRTTVIISHRLSTLRQVDQIIYLRAGEVIERGTHEVLLAKGGAYWALHQRQLLGRALERLGAEGEREDG